MSSSNMTGQHEECRLPAGQGLISHIPKHVTNSCAGWQVQEEEASSLKRKQPASTSKQRSIRDFFKVPLQAQKHSKVRGQGEDGRLQVPRLSS